MLPESLPSKLDFHHVLPHQNLTHLDIFPRLYVACLRKTKLWLGLGPHAIQIITMKSSLNNQNGIEFEIACENPINNVFAKSQILHYGVPSVSLFQHEVFPWCATAIPGIKFEFALKAVASAENSR